MFSMEFKLETSYYGSIDLVYHTHMCVSVCLTQSGGCSEPLAARHTATETNNRRAARTEVQVRVHPAKFLAWFVSHVHFKTKCTVLRHFTLWSVSRASIMFSQPGQQRGGSDPRSHRWIPFKQREINWLILFSFF